MARYTYETEDATRVVFREPRKTDARQMMQVINSVMEEPMSGIMMNKKVRLKDEVKWLDHVLTDIRRRILVMLVAEVDGRILGNCEISRLSYKEMHRAVLGIVLCEELRGKGVGEALMKRTIELATLRMKGIEQIDLKTFSYNRRAQRLYKKLGFVETGFVPRAIREGKDYYGEYAMVLYLKDRPDLGSP